MSDGDLDRVLGVVDQPHEARHGGDARFRRDLLRGDLVAHRLDGIDRRADEGDALGLQPLGEFGAFGQEAVARMDGVRAGLLAGRDDPVDHQVALRRGGRADQHRLVGHLDMQRIGVGLGMHGDGADAEALRGLEDAAGDFTAVGDKDFREH
jgi:hypothetical protein